MSYVVDTDVTLDFLLDRPASVGLLAQLRRHGIAISVITYMEIAEGIAGGRAPHQQWRGFHAFLRGVRVLVISRSIADRAAMVRLELRRQNHSIEHRVLDILIAATAIEHRLILVTRNVRDYADIPGLQLQAMQM